jgi:hypothetical protein
VDDARDVYRHIHRHVPNPYDPDGRRTVSRDCPSCRVGRAGARRTRVPSEAGALEKKNGRHRVDAARSGISMIDAGDRRDPWLNR